jgi:hypothetical protein
MDTVLMAMQADADKNGFELRVLFPGKTADYSYDKMLLPNRANVLVEQGSDGKLRVTNKFSLG